ncbi:conserved hypothetical protein [Vibrio phage 249E41-1]|nr:conserved hypothetical protein [Vibrio phage 249E41-1]
MTFGKKAVQQGGNTGSTKGGGNFDATAWNEWNSYINEEVLDGSWVKQPNGKFKKEIEAIGVLNFIMDIGTQSQGDASMESKLAKPEENEEYSAEELAEMEKYPSNYFKWVDDYRDGKKLKVRKKFWPQQPEAELIFAVDFPALQADYSKHPMADEGASEDLKAYRIDYNGKDFKDKTQLGRHITNEVHWKTKKFNDKDVKYKIASAGGFIDEYMNDGHDLAHLVQAKTNWTIVVTKTVKTTDDGKEIVYYNQSIKDPAPIVDIKERSGVYTAEEQIKDLPAHPEFCGILLNGGEYTKEQLTEVRGMWWGIAKQASTFDRNEGTTRDGEWIVGEGWDGSDLEKAYIKFGFNEAVSSQNNTQGVSGSQGDSSNKAPTPQHKAPEKQESVKDAPTYNEPPLDFDDD